MAREFVNTSLYNDANLVVKKRVSWNNGKKASPETIEKLRKSHLGKKLSPESIAKRTAKIVGRPSPIKGRIRIPRGKKNCVICGKEYTQKWGVTKKQWANQTCCSRKCFSITKKGVKHTSEHNEKISKGLQGRIVSENTRQKIREKNIGKPHYNQRGENNPNWKGGHKDENLKIRASLEFTLWRRSVFARDNFTCQKYGIKGGILHAHHINNFADFPELRLAIDNGITLSDKAHREFHKKFGVRNNTGEQLKQFLNNNG